MTFEDKCAKAAGYRNPGAAMTALLALAKEVKTYEGHHILAGYMEATIMRSMGGVPACAQTRGTSRTPESRTGTPRGASTA